MTDAEIARAIRAEITKIEAGLASIDLLATEDFRSRVKPEILAKAQNAHFRAVKAIAALHKALDKGNKSPASGDGPIAYLGK